jgi:hypothetical protein
VIKDGAGDRGDSGRSTAKVNVAGGAELARLALTKIVVVEQGTGARPDAVTRLFAAPNILTLGTKVTKLTPTGPVVAPAIATASGAARVALVRDTEATASDILRLKLNLHIRIHRVYRLCGQTSAAKDANHALVSVHVAQDDGRRGVTNVQHFKVERDGRGGQVWVFD